MCVRVEVVVMVIVDIEDRRIVVVTMIVGVGDGCIIVVFVGDRCIFFCCCACGRRPIV